MDVLIAEDEPVSRRLLEANLARWGHTVQTCVDGHAAWAALQKDDCPRIAILDWMMPGVEGPEVCRRTRALPHGKLLHLILLTARDRREDIVTGLDAGANDYITKPFDRDELRARLSVGLRVIELQETLIQAERYRILTQAAGAAAHEINQPLTALVGNADLMLMRMSPDDPLRDRIDELRKAGRRIAAIVAKMQSVRRVVTRPYIQGVDIIDFDASAGEQH